VDLEYIEADENIRDIELMVQKELDDLESL
jgi:hypothetical protein